MFSISHNGKIFTLKIIINEPTFELNETVFNSHKDYLKSKDLYFNKSSYCYPIKPDMIDAYIEWFSRDNWKFYLDDIALKELQIISDSYRKKVKFFRGLSIDPSVIKSEYKLKDYQIESGNFCVKRSGSFCFDPPGMGKSLIALTVFSSWYKLNYIDSIFLVVRTGLDYQWKSEILKFSSIFTDDDIGIITNDNKVKPFEEFKNKKIIIIQNHLLARMLSSYGKVKKSQKLSTLHWKKSYVNIKKEWDKKNICLLIDESHEISNVDNVITKASLSIFNEFDFLLSLTATPNTDKFERIHPMSKLIDPSIFPCSYYAFVLRLAKNIGTKHNKYKITKYKDDEIEKVQRKLKVFSIQHKKEDHFDTRQIEKEIKFDLTPKHRQLYQMFLQEEILKLQEEYDKIKLKLILHDSKFPYFLQIIENPLLLKGKVVNEKFNSLLDKWTIKDDRRYHYLAAALKDTRPDNKLLVFENHPATLDLLAKEFSKYEPLVIHGKVKEKKEERDQIRLDFNNPNHPSRVLFANPPTAGVGGNYNGACNKIIMWSIPCGGRLFKQTIERVWRANSETDSMIEYLLMASTFDMIRYNRNQNRVELTENLLNTPVNRGDIINLFQGII